MSRQHATPILLAADGLAAEPLIALPLGADGHGLSEAAIQNLIQQHPSCLPIAEIDPQFVDPVPICTELNTPAGPIDNFMVTASGLPVLVECKLWRNPEGRREVVGQILDYAKELSRWTCSDLQREVSRRLKCEGNVLLELVRCAGHDVDEIAFNDALTLNLRRGRFLLLIVGDGIRQGVETIAEYLQGHSGLHFTLGLVELPIFAAATGHRLVVPRVLAKTERIVRTVIDVPDGMAIIDGEEFADVEDGGPAGVGDAAVREALRLARRAERQEFWAAFLAGFRLDDPEQQVPRQSSAGNIALMMPAPRGSCWITIYRSVSSGNVGVFLSRTRGSVGEQACLMLRDQQEELQRELGESVSIRFDDDDFSIWVKRPLGNFAPSPERDEALIWLREQANLFVTALRPRIRSAVDQLTD